MTEYETRVLQSLRSIENFLQSLDVNFSEFATTLEGLLTVFFLPLLFLILSVLILKWISRW